MVMVVHADDELLTVKEVAQLLKVPTAWVYERCRGYASDRLPHVKFGKYLRFHKNDLIVAVFLAKTQRPVVNCGFCWVRIFYIGCESMCRLEREITGVGE
jgi:excisionase family DNA binding protein